MNSKEALRTIGNTATKFIKSDGIGRPRIYYSIREMKKKEINIIKQDLDRLEQLEKENQELKEKFKMLEENEDVVLTTLEISVQENTKFKKALDILKGKLELPLEDDFDVINKDDIHLYRLRTKALVNEEEYELLKSVLGEE